MKQPAAASRNRRTISCSPLKPDVLTNRTVFNFVFVDNFRFRELQTGAS